MFRKTAELRLVHGELVIECLGRDIEENALCLGNLARLRNADCQIAVDDFGAGMGSPSNLLAVTPDYGLHRSRLERKRMSTVLPF
jgi:EAL domain-containing protein (putative c-di-GMP-specific phosphodiesterase class I)